MRLWHERVKKQQRRHEKARKIRHAQREKEQKLQEEQMEAQERKLREQKEAEALAEEARRLKLLDEKRKVTENLEMREAQKKAEREAKWRAKGLNIEREEERYKRETKLRQARATSKTPLLLI